MGKTIHRFDPDAEHYTEEGCFILELSNSAEDEAVSIARARVEVGVTTRLHRLRGVAERYLILEGQGLVEVGNSTPAHVAAGDVVCIPQGVSQRVANTGDCDLVFLAICTPRFVPAVYEDIDGAG